MRHSRSKSFSDSLVLEDADKGGVIVKSIRADSSSDISLKEGDEIVGATIHFDNLKKDEVLRVLKLIEPYDEKIKVLTKQDLKANVSSGTLNNRIASPNEMLKDSYNRLFHNKVQRFLNAENSENIPHVKIGGLNDQHPVQIARLRDIHSGPNVKGPEMDLDGDLETPDLNLSAPKIKGEMNAPGLGVDLPKADFNGPKIDMKSPDLDIDAPSGKFSMPKFGLPAPKVKGPDFGIDAGLKTPELNLKSPKIKGGIKTPNNGLNLPNGDMGGSGLNVDVPDVDLKSPSQQFKLPALPKFGLSGPKINSPEVGIDGDVEIPDLNFSAPKINGEMNTPGLGVDFPKADFKSPKIDMKSPDLDIDALSGKFSMPKFGLPAPKVKGPDFGIDAGLKTPELNLKSPKIKGGIKTPELDADLPSVDMKGNKLNVDVPDIGLKSPSGKLKFPTLPKFGISGPKVKRPELNIDGDFKTPDLNLSAPEFKGEMNAPGLGVDFPKADFKSPKIDMKSPDLDIDAPSGKFSMPKFGLPAPKVKGPDFGIDAGLKTPELNLKSPKIKGGIKTPELDADLPSVDMKGNKLNVDVPDIGLKSPSGKLKFPTLPKFGISGPKVKRPELNIDGDFKTPDLNLSAPEFKGEMNAPGLGVDFPKADFKSPKIDMKSPDLDIDAPSGKFSMPKFGLPAPKVKGPDFGIDAGLKTPELNLKSPKIKGGIKTPELDADLPSVDMKGNKLNVDVPDIGLKSPSGKLKFPTLPKFGISGPKVKRPELNIDGDFETPDLNFSAPKIKGEMNAPGLGVDFPKADFKSPKMDMKTPDLDIDAPSGKFSMPKFGLSAPKVKGPDFGIDAGLKTPELNLKSPKIKGGIKTPELDADLPSVDMKGNKLNVDVPDFGLKSPSGKIKFPTLPKFGISGPKMKRPELDIDGDFKTPDLNLSAPKIKGEMNAPGLGVDFPKADFKSPKIDMKSPDLGIDAPSGKIRMPKFSLSAPKVKGPDFGIDAGLKTPELNLKSPKIKGGIKTPDLDADLPSGDINGPKLNFKMPNVDLKPPRRQFKFPTLPRLGISGPKVKGPKVDIDGGLKRPDLSLSSPKIKGKFNSPKLGVDLPKGDFNIPKLDMTTPNLDIDAPSGKFAMPKFSVPKVKGQDFHIDTDVKTPNLNLTAPKIRGGMKAPDGRLHLPSADMKVPKLDMNAPNVNLSAPKIKGKMNAPGFGVDLPKADFHRPKLDMKTPDLDIDAPSGKFTVPELNLSKPNFKRPDFDIDADLNTPDLNITGPKIKGRVKTPKVDVDLPSGNMKGPNLDLKSSNIDLKSDIIGSDFSFPDVFHYNLPETDLKESKVKLNAPHLDLDAPSGKLNVNVKPKYEFSDLNLNRQQLDIDAVFNEENLSAPKMKSSINTPDIDLRFPKNNTKSTQLGLQASNTGVNSERMKIPTVMKTKSGSSGPSMKEQYLHANLKTQDMFLFNSKDQAELNTSATSVNSLKTGTASDNILCAPDIDLDVPGGTLKGSKSMFYKTFM